MQEIVDPLSFIDDMQYDENSSSNEISSNIEKLSDEEKIDLLIGHLTLLSKKYGLGEVKFWYEPFSDGYKNFSIKISPDKSADELIDILYKIEYLNNPFDQIKENRSLQTCPHSKEKIRLIVQKNSDPHFQSCSPLYFAIPLFFVVFSHTFFLCSDLFYILVLY